MLKALARIARAASREVLAVYGRAFDVRVKADDSPVTLADLRAERVIVPALHELLPQWPVVAEEAAAAGRWPKLGSGPYWLVDPLDGTREFVSRNGEFTVNIAGIDGGRPVLGVVRAPAAGITWAGAWGAGAWRVDGDAADNDDDDDDAAWTPIAVRDVPAAGLTVLESRSHNDDAAVAAFLAGHRVAERRVAGSSVKLCLIAQGDGDCYPRFGPTMPWDIAAGQAVLEAAGGAVLAWPGGAALRYADPRRRNPDFVAWGRPPAGAGPRDASGETPAKTAGRRLLE